MNPEEEGKKKKKKKKNRKFIFAFPIYFFGWVQVMRNCC
jgi:hypothetical protein